MTSVSSVIELALARLVEKAALVLRPAGMALSDTILPLNNLRAQPLSVSPLAGPLHPPGLTGLFQQCCPRGHRGCVVSGAWIPTGLHDLPVACSGWRRAPRWGQGWARPRLQDDGAAGDIDRHTGVLDEQVLQGAALQVGRPQLRPLCSETGGRRNKPALIQQARGGWLGTWWGSKTIRQVNNEPSIHFFLILRADEGFRGGGLLRGWAGAKEEAGEALEHGV